MFTDQFKQEIAYPIAHGRSSSFAQVCHSSSSKEELEVSIVLRIHENFLVILDYSYGEKTARLTGKKFFFSRSAIDQETWKVFPLFVQPNSTQVCGIHISQKVDGEWQSLEDIPNFKEAEYSMVSDIGSAGFKLV